MDIGNSIIYYGVKLKLNLIMYSTRNSKCQVLITRLIIGKTTDEINNGSKLTNKRERIRNNISVEIGKLTEKFGKIRQMDCFDSLKNNVVVSNRFIIIEYFDKTEPNINNDWLNIFDSNTKINYNRGNYVIMSKKKNNDNTTKNILSKISTREKT